MLLAFLNSPSLLDLTITEWKRAGKAQPALPVTTYLLSDSPYFDSVLGSVGDSFALVPSKPVGSGDGLVRRHDSLNSSSLLDSSVPKFPTPVHSRSEKSMTRHLKDDDRRLELIDFPALSCSVSGRSRDQLSSSNILEP
ncbi:hypothetical protein Ancab_004376 [Ancistrocladus abbreviatus]